MAVWWWMRKGPAVMKPAGASLLSAAVKLLDRTGVLDVMRSENEAKAAQRRRDQNGNAVYANGRGRRSRAGKN